MKTKIMTLALSVVIAAAGFSASAQKETKKNCDKKARKECAMKAGERKDKCAVEARECDGKGKEASCRGRNCDKLFEGITLSAEQKAKIEAFKQKEKAEMDKAAKDRMKKADKERANIEKKMDKRMEKMDKEMKQILSPEQYAQFKSNASKVKAERKAKGGDKARKHKGQKGCKGGDCKKSGDCKNGNGCKGGDCKKSGDCKNGNGCKGGDCKKSCEGKDAKCSADKPGECAKKK